MIDGIEDIFFKLNVLHLFILQYNVFPDALHCIQVFCILLFDKKNFPEGTLTNHFDNLEV